jgi:hypothetical protein
MSERFCGGKFRKMETLKPVHIKRTRMPWRNMVLIALAIAGIIKILRLLRVRFSKF